MSKHYALLLALLLLTPLLMMPIKPVFAASPTENTWEQKTQMPTARGGLGVIAADGKIYAIGGATSLDAPPYFYIGAPPDSSHFLRTNEQYDPATDTWVTKTPMPTPRAFFAIAAYEGKIYCIGGQIGWRQEPAADYLWGSQETAVNEVYDIAEDTWSTLTPMPFSNNYLHASVINDRIYVISPGACCVYNPSNDSWSSIASMPYPQGGAWSKALPIASIGENIYSTGQIASTILIYDTTDNSWSKGEVGPQHIDTGAGAATNGINAPIRFYIMGYSPQVSIAYDPQTAVWTNTSAMPTQRIGFGLTVINDVIYAIGGFTTGANEMYIPIGYGAPDPSYVLEHTPPKISLLSPMNQTYNESSVSLVFTVDKAANWTSFSLDGQQNVTITGNSTLTNGTVTSITISNMTNGLHHITVYANDTFGNMGTSDIGSFTIATGEPFPTTLLIGSVIAVVAVVGLGLLVYLKKRKN
jgi:Kelch motif